MATSELKLEYQARILELKKIIDSDPTNFSFVELAELYRISGRLAEAYEVARNGCRINPDNPWGHFVFGNVCLEMGKLSEAEKELRTSTALLSRDIEPYLILGQTLMRRRDYSGARVVLVRLEEIFPTKPEVTRFRRYLEQKLLPPMDFGVPTTEHLLERIRGQALPPPPVRLSSRAVEITLPKDESGFNDRAKNLITKIKDFRGIESVVFVTKDNKIFRTTNTSPNVVKLFTWIIRSFARLLQRSPKALHFGNLKNTIIEMEHSKIFIVVMREGYLGIIMNEDLEFGSFRIQLSRLFRKYDLNQVQV